MWWSRKCLFVCLLLRGEGYGGQGSEVRGRSGVGRYLGPAGHTRQAKTGQRLAGHDNRRSYSLFSHRTAKRQTNVWEGTGQYDLSNDI